MFQILKASMRWIPVFHNYNNTFCECSKRIVIVFIFYQIVKFLIKIINVRIVHFFKFSNKLISKSATRIPGFSDFQASQDSAAPAERLIETRFFRRVMHRSDLDFTVLRSPLLFRMARHDSRPTAPAVFLMKRLIRCLRSLCEYL